MHDKAIGSIGGLAKTFEQSQASNGKIAALAEFFGNTSELPDSAGYVW